MEAYVEPEALYPPRSMLLDGDAPERWIFLDYEDDGRVVALTPQQYESIYRPDPDDQG
jgi:hypothetical protein